MGILKCIRDFDFFISGSYSEDFLANFDNFHINIYTYRNVAKTPHSNLNTAKKKEEFNEFERNISQMNRFSFTPEVNLFGDGELNIYEHLKKYEENNKNKTVICM